MRKQDQELSKKYKKNKRFEHVVSSLNEQLFHSQQNILENLEEKHPSIHILGAPRSGTTLLSQLIPSYLPVGHINNLIATFWKAPIYGIELSKKLIQQEYQSNFTSDFGRTSAINEPHEFGYFWNYHLQYDDLTQKLKSHEKNIDWLQLSTVIKNMTHSFQKPIVFKSFLLGFHAKLFYETLPKSCFIYVKRNIVDNALSIIKLREKLNGDKNLWGSIKPKQYPQLKNLTVYEQVIGQILCLEHEYLEQLETIPQKNKLICNYEDICNDPTSFLEMVNQKFLTNSEIPIKNISPFKINKRQINVDDKKEILSAIDKIHNLYPNLKTI
ncbi:sulfotransferase [Marixanthomonas sp. SCSIO 43207]|uniref:sulfotransferase n=1 Tax=Marixanthomonas sp. SCSIO 43207 TaxID=2779360 RepID=UPI001CA8BA9B|nr:sulfotransferase [Marixanthomonas sp. SCSIO 43207]UAB80427.1 sulfotransferase [Marixanthomonas sp. SCSIO 43207]